VCSPSGSDRWKTRVQHGFDIAVVSVLMVAVTRAQHRLAARQRDFRSAARRWKTISDLLLAGAIGLSLNRRDHTHARERKHSRESDDVTHSAHANSLYSARNVRPIHIARRKSPREAVSLCAYVGDGPDKRRHRVRPVRVALPTCVVHNGTARSTAIRT
jgi:hypothetical protein